MEKQGFFDQGKPVAGRIKKIPGVRDPVDQGEVKAAGEIIQCRVGFGERVGHHRMAAFLLEGGGEAPGGGVVPIAESGGKDEDGGGAHISPSRSNSSNRRSSCWSTISVTPASSSRMSRHSEIFSLGRPVVSMTRRPRVK